METARFTERAAVQGYVTKDMYEDFIESLGDTGKLYSVELEHRQAAFEPEYKLTDSLTVMLRQDTKHIDVSGIQVVQF
jgi:hypothetical protein